MSGSNHPRSHSLDADYRLFGSPDERRINDAPSFTRTFHYVSDVDFRLPANSDAEIRLNELPPGFRLHSPSHNAWNPQDTDLRNAADIFSYFHAPPTQGKIRLITLFYLKLV